MQLVVSEYVFSAMQIVCQVYQTELPCYFLFPFHQCVGVAPAAFHRPENVLDDFPL